MAVNNVVEMVELNERVKKVETPEDAVNITKEYEKILREKRKGVIVVAFYQGKIFKRFKEK